MGDGLWIWFFWAGECLAGARVREMDANWLRGWVIPPHGDAGGSGTPSGVPPWWVARSVGRRPNMACRQRRRRPTAKFGNPSGIGKRYAYSLLIQKRVWSDSVSEAPCVGVPAAWAGTDGVCECVRLERRRVRHVF